jgi:protein ImuA
MPAESRDQLLHELSQRIREIEATVRLAHSAPVSLGIPALEDWLPERRLVPGSLVELLSAAGGAGAWTLALFFARNACGSSKVLVVVDAQACFYPPAAVSLGIAMDRLIVIHPKTLADAALAVDQSLRSSAVGSVIGWYDRLTTAAFRRLQLAAESGGGLGLLLRPISARSTPSFAALRLCVTPKAEVAKLRRVHLESLRCRGGPSGQSLILEFDDATGDVCLAAGLASAAGDARPTRAAK